MIRTLTSRPAAAVCSLVSDVSAKTIERYSFSGIRPASFGMARETVMIFFSPFFKHETLRVNADPAGRGFRTFLNAWINCLDRAVFILPPIGDKNADIRGLFFGIGDFQFTGRAPVRPELDVERAEINDDSGVSDRKRGGGQKNQSGKSGEAKAGEAFHEDGRVANRWPGPD